MYSTDTPCTPCTRKVILVQFSHNLYVQKSVRIPRSFVILFAHPPPPPPRPDDIYYQRMSEILISNYHFFNIT